MRRLPAILPVMALLAIVGTASGALTLSSTSGTWNNPVLQSMAPTPTYGSLLGGHQIYWGTAKGYGQTYLCFKGAATPADIVLDTPFAAGTLRHYNSPISLNSGITSVDLNVSLNLGSGPLNTLMTLGITETPGPGLTGGGSDRITLPTAFSPQPFEVGGATYELCLLGFGSSPTSLISCMETPESLCGGCSNCTTLWAQVCGTTPPVPAPGALVLAAIGAGAVSWLRRRRAL